MNWLDYFVVGSAVVSISLIWRNLLLDHAALLASVKKIPLVGEMLQCGFCFPMWVSLVAVLLVNPASSWEPAVVQNFSENGAWVFRTVFGWLSLGMFVIFFRSLVASMADQSAVLSHRHRSLHD